MGIYGIGGGANVLVAQYSGKKDFNSIYKVLSCAYTIAFCFAGFLCMAALIIPQHIMNVFTEDTSVIELGTSYLRIIAVSYLFYAATSITTCVLRAVNTVMISMILSSCTLCINIVLNYALIFGKLGAPCMGIAGAAIGTLIARMIEFILLILYLYLIEDKLKIRIKKLKYDKTITRIYLSSSIPVILNELFWALGEGEKKENYPLDYQCTYVENGDILETKVCHC